MTLGYETCQRGGRAKVRARTDVQKYLWRHRCEYERGTSPWVTCMWHKSLFGHGRDGGGMNEDKPDAALSSRKWIAGKGN